MLVLAVIVPALIRFLRPYYNQQVAYYPLSDGGFSDGEEPELENLERVDVHLAFASCVIIAVFFVCAALSTTKLALSICKGADTLLLFIA